MSNPEHQQLVHYLPGVFRDFDPDMPGEATERKLDSIMRGWHFLIRDGLKPKTIVLNSCGNNNGITPVVMDWARIRQTMGPNDFAGPYISRDNTGEIKLYPNSVAIYGKTATAQVVDSQQE